MSGRCQGIGSFSGKARRDLVAISSRQPAMLHHNDATTTMVLASRVAGQKSNNKMNSKPPYYRIYLLTVWQERSRGPPEGIVWRFRLEDPRSGQQQAFADAATLMTALQALIATPVPAKTQEENEE